MTEEKNDPQQPVQNAENDKAENDKVENDKAETDNVETDQTENQQEADDQPTIKDVVTVSDAGPCRKKITVEILEDKIKQSLEKHFSELSKDAVVPGFRKGRAPRRLIEKRFGKDISQQVKLELLAESSESAIKDSNIETLGEPDVDHEKVELPGTGSMKFEFEVDVKPDFELPELEGLEIEKKGTEITDDDVKHEIEAIQKRLGIWEPQENAKVETGCKIVANVTITIEGEQEDEKKDNIEIFVGENGFISGITVEGLDKKLKGAKAGDKKTVNVDVPKTYFNEQYRGKKIQIDIEIKDIKTLVPAELNEEFFQKIGIADIDELTDKITESRTQQAEDQARSYMSDQVYDHLLKKAEFDLPEGIVADQATRILQRQYSNLLLNKTPKEEVEERMKGLQGSSEKQAKEQLKQFFIMDKIADKLGVEVSEEQLNGYIAQVAMQRGRRPEKMREEMLKDGSLAQFSLQVREQKCIEKILETAVIKEVKAETKKKTTKKKATAPAEKKTKKTTKKATTKKTAKKTASEKADGEKKVSKKTSPKKDKKD